MTDPTRQRGATSRAQGRAEERAVRALYEAAGCSVWGTGDAGGRRGKHGHRGTHGRDPGMADFHVGHEGLGLSWWHEVKAGPHAALNMNQRAFRLYLGRTGQPLVVGDRQAAIAHLVAQGILSAASTVYHLVLTAPRPAMARLEERAKTEARRLRRHRKGAR